MRRECNIQPRYLLIYARFLLAELQIEYVLNKKEARAMEKALDSLPTTLDKAYEDIMNRMERKNTKEFALRVFTCVLNAERTLHIDALRELLVVEVGDKELKRKYLS